MADYEPRFSDVQRVDIVAGTGLIGTMNTVAIGGGSVVSIFNSAGWVVSMANTGGAYTLSGSSYIVNTAGWAVYVNGSLNVINTGGTVKITGSSYLINTAGWVVSASATILNSAGWVVSVANTGGAYTLASGVAWVGTISTIAIGGGSAVDIINSAGWVVGVGSTSIVNSAGWVVAASAQLQASVAQIGSARVLFYGANSVNLTEGAAKIGTAYTIMLPSSMAIYNAQSVQIINSAGWAINVINTAGIAVNVINTSGLRTRAALETDSMSSSGNLVTVSHGTIIAALTNNTIISQQSNKTIRVLAFEMMADGATQCRFESGTADTVYLTGYKYFGTSGGMVAPYNPVGWFQTNIGSSLNLEIVTAGASIGGCLTYLVL